MINGLSKYVTLYLSIILTLTALLLTFFSFLSPVLLLQDKVALLSVTPSTALTQPGSSGTIDGPTVRMGVLGSCSKSNNAGSLTCTSPSLSPQFDLSVLPSNTPDLLTAPTATTPVFIAIALGFTSFFLLLFTLVSLSDRLPAALQKHVQKPIFVRSVAWVGLLGFMIGLTSFLVLRMWFGKAVEDFNTQIQEDGSGAPQLVSSVGNGFTMVWVAYAFLTVPLVTSLARLHVTSGGGGGKA